MIFNRLSGFWVCLAWVLLPQVGQANPDVTLAPIFSDHMVLQQESVCKIWGMADPGDEIVVTFQDQSAQATANAKGQWIAAIQTPKAGGPYKLEVSRKSGEPKIVLSDVMVGEVWICSGQSNMEWPVEGAENPEKEIDSAKDFPQIRLFTIEHHAMLQPQTEFGRCLQWSACSPDSVRAFSATAYFFGRSLQKHYNVPIGLIDTSWGGTPCEAWTAESTLEENPMFSGLLKAWRENTDPNATHHPHRPGILYNGMIAPLQGFAFRGAIWYQGESNVGRGEQYATLFPALIHSWRKHLAQGHAFPFLFVQIAPFRYQGQDPEALAEIWDAQLKTYRTLENVGMAVTTDIGNVRDIHPTNKQEVGARLALWAVHLAYQDRVGNDAAQAVFSGPLFRECQIVGSKIQVRFDFTGGQLKPRDDQKLSHFTICGSDQKFVPAQAEIDGDSVWVSSPEVSEPVAVRFAWSDSAEPNLVNAAGLPASPFRTDQFPLKSAGK